MPAVRARAISSLSITFWVTVASRPPHSAGQLMAAHRPWFRQRRQARRRPLPPPPPRPPAPPAGGCARGSRLARVGLSCPPPGEYVREVVAEPLPELVAERLVLGRHRKVHRAE